MAISKIGSDGLNQAVDTILCADSGNVGIGTSSPDSSNKLQVTGDIGVTWATDKFIGMKFASGTSYKMGLVLKDSTRECKVWSQSSDSDDKITFYTGSTPSERARINSSGSFMVGTTIENPVSNNVIGFSARGQYGETQICTDGAVSGAPLYLNRKTNDGSIVEFRKDGSTVGVIGSIGGCIRIGSAESNLRFNFGAGQAVIPATSAGAVRDNIIDLGESSARFNDIYATNGTIQTSDRNEKQDIETLLEAETRVAVACKGLLRKFRWKDAVVEKGDEARIHFGIIAQDLQAAFAAEGLDAGRYAMFISSTWTDEETGEERTRLGVRYPELLAFIIGAI